MEDYYALIKFAFTPFFIFLFGLACMPNSAAYIFFVCGLACSIVSFFGIREIIKKHQKEKDKEGE